MKRASRTQTAKRILWSILILLALGLSYGFYYINSLLPIITGYPAKYLCSAVFVSEREQAEVEAMDLNFSFIKYTKNIVNLEDSSVTSSFLWGKSKAIYRKGFGATLLRGIDEAELRKIKFPKLEPVTYNQDTITWPMGNILPDTTTNINKETLSQITEKLMDEDGYNGHALSAAV